MASLLFRLEVDSIWNNTFLSSLMNTHASYTNSAVLILIAGTFRFMMGSKKRFFFFIWSCRFKTLNYQKKFLSVFELSTLTTFNRQCHFLSIFRCKKKHTNLASSEIKNRKFIAKDSVGAKLNREQIVSKQNRLKN